MLARRGPGRLCAGERVAQRGDGVVRSGQPRGGGGEGGIVPPLVVLADAGGVTAGRLGRGRRRHARAGAVRACPPSASRLRQPGVRVQRAAGVTAGASARRRARALSASIAARAWAAAARGSAASSSAACRARLAGGLGAGLPDLGGGLGADGLSLRFGSLGVAGAASWPPRAASWSRTAGSCAPSRRSRRARRRGWPRPADGRGDRPVLALAPGQLLAVPECGHGGVPDQHRRAVPAVFGDLLLAVAGPGPGGLVLDPGRAGAHPGQPADARGKPAACVPERFWS